MTHSMQDASGSLSSPLTATHSGGRILQRCGSHGSRKVEQKKSQQLNKRGRTHGETTGKGQASEVGGSRTSRVASLWKVSRSNTPCSTSRTNSKAEVIKFWVITSRSLTPARNLQGQGGTEKCECPHLPPNDIPSVLCIKPHFRSVTACFTP